MKAGNERRREAVDDPLLWRFYLIDATLLVRDHGVYRRV
jgi:hypothetical protein